MKITILGCGASKGVPMIGCKCEVCNSSNIKNKRSRTSILIQKEDVKVLVDAGADFRQQALIHNISQVNGILFTHCHADHTAGAADLATLAYASEGIAMPVYSNHQTLNYLMQTSYYLFASPEKNFTSFEIEKFITPERKCYLIPNLIEEYKIFTIGNLDILPILQYHGDMDSLGFIIENFAYCTDVKSFYPEAWQHLLQRKLKLLIISCIGFKEMFKHVHFDLLMEWIKELDPETVILTHMGHTIEYEDIKFQIDSYVKQNKLKTNILPAYDGLEFKL